MHPKEQKWHTHKYTREEKTFFKNDKPKKKNTKTLASDFRFNASIL